MPANLTVIDVLYHARSMIDMGFWVKGPLAVDKHGNEIGTSDPRFCRGCSLGNIEHVCFLRGEVEEHTHPWQHGSPVYRCLDSRTDMLQEHAVKYTDHAACALGWAENHEGESGLSTTGYWNDRYDITRQDVLKVYDRALELARNDEENNR